MFHNLHWFLGLMSGFSLLSLFSLGSYKSTGKSLTDSEEKNSLMDHWRVVLVCNEILVILSIIGTIFLNWRYEKTFILIGVAGTMNLVSAISSGRIIVSINNCTDTKYLRTLQRSSNIAMIIQSAILFTVFSIMVVEYYMAWQKRYEVACIRVSSYLF